MSENDEKILFFDGVCGLCNSFVDFVMTADSSSVYKLSPLQGKTAQKLLPQEDIEELTTFVYYENGQTYRRSTAALKVISGLGGIWSVFKVFLILPSSLRDTIYSIVSKNRYRWFGKKETCRLPTPEERTRFLP